MCAEVYRPILAPLEKAKSAQTLICLLQGMEGKVTTVELRNDNTVTGKIEHVDAFMCVTMSNVIFKTPHGQSMRFSDFFVHGSNIRYVQIPNEVNIMKTIEYKCNRQKRVLAQLQKEHDERVQAAEKKAIWQRKAHSKMEAKERKTQMYARTLSQHTESPHQSKTNL